MQAAWRSLEELVERNSLSCHCCSSPEVQSCPGNGKVDASNVPRRSAWRAETHKALKMHVARKSLEVQLGALPERLLLSQQQARGRQCRRILPKLIKPGQTQPLLQHHLSPLLQVEGDCTAGSILKKQGRKQWEGPNPQPY